MSIRTISERPQAKRFKDLPPLYESDDSFSPSPSRSTVSPSPGLDADALNNQKRRGGIDDDISPARETNLRNIDNVLSPNNPLHLSPGSANVLLGEWNQQLPEKLQKSKMKFDLNLLKKKMTKKEQGAANKWFKNASEEEKQQVLDEFHRVPFRANEEEWFGIPDFIRKKYKEKKRRTAKKLKSKREREAYLATVRQIEDDDDVSMGTPPKSNTARKSRKRKSNTAKKSKKRKRKTNKAKGKGNKITKKQTKNKCPTRQKRKTTWIVQNSRRYINAFKRTKKPGENLNFNKIVEIMEEGEMVDGYWIVQWRLDRTPGRYGHYFLAYQYEYPLDVKAKNKNIHIDNIGGYKKSKTRKRNKKRRSRRTRK